MCPGLMCPKPMWRRPMWWPSTARSRAPGRAPRPAWRGPVRTVAGALEHPPAPACRPGVRALPARGAAGADGAQVTRVAAGRTEHGGGL